MRTGLFEWIKQKKGQRSWKRSFHSEYARRAVSLFLAFDLLVVSVFCFSLNTGNTRAALLNGSVAWSDPADSRYAGYGGITGSALGRSQDHPFIIKSAEELYGLSLIVNGSRASFTDTEKRSAADLVAVFCNNIGISWTNPYIALDAMIEELAIVGETPTDGAVDQLPEPEEGTNPVPGEGEGAGGANGGAAEGTGGTDAGSGTGGSSDGSQSGGENGGSPDSGTDPDTDSGADSGTDSGTDSGSDTGSGTGGGSSDGSQSGGENGGTPDADASGSQGGSGDSSGTGDSGSDSGSGSGSDSGSGSGSGSNSGAGSDSGSGSETGGGAESGDSGSSGGSTDGGTSSGGSSSGGEATGFFHTIKRLFTSFTGLFSGRIYAVDENSGASEDGSGDSASEGSPSVGGSTADTSGSDSAGTSGSGSGSGADPGDTSGSSGANSGSSTSGNESTGTDSDSGSGSGADSENGSTGEDAGEAAGDTGETGKNGEGTGTDQGTGGETGGAANGGITEGTNAGATSTDSAVSEQMAALLSLEAQVKALVITLPEQLQNGMEGYYFDIQASAIDMSGFNSWEASTGGGTNLVNAWYPIGEEQPFQGHVFSTTNVVFTKFTYANSSAVGHSIYGLFGMLGDKAEVSNLRFSGVTFYVTDKGMNQSGSSMGVLAAANSGVVSDIEVTTSAYVGADSANPGGIALAGTGTAPSRFGGVVGTNSGTIQNCTFEGDIYRKSETQSGALDNMEAGGIGGIAGYSQGAVRYCVARANITFGEAAKETDMEKAAVAVSGQMAMAGGIVGYMNKTDTSEGIAENCVFSGRIAGKAKDATCMVGGIVGLLQNKTSSGVAGTQVRRCIASADIQWYSDTASSTSDMDKGVGGVVGRFASGTTVEECFGLGGLDTMNVAAGGIAGYFSAAGSGDSVTINNCYYSGSVRNAFNETVEMTKVGPAGGLVGLAKLNISMRNNYFSGSTLTSHTASLVGNSHASISKKTEADVSGNFYDSMLSPNQAILKEDKVMAGLAAARTTDELCSAAFDGFSDASADTSTGSAVWHLRDGAYPALVWTEQTDDDPEAPAAYRDLVQNLSEISTYRWLDVTDSSAFTPEDTASPSALQAKSGFQMDEPSALTGALTGAAICTVIEDKIKGNYTAEDVGVIYRPVIEFKAGEMSCTVPVTRKILYAFRQDQNALNEIDTAETYYRFLDYCNAGSGAYIGTKFSFASGAAIDVSAGSAAAPFDFKRNLFCGTIEGNGAEIIGVHFSDGSKSLLGDGVFGGVTDLSFREVSAGTEAAAISKASGAFGLLYGSLYSGTIGNITITEYEMNIEEPYLGTASGPTNSRYSLVGGVAGLVENPAAAISNVSIDGIKARVGNFSATKNQIANRINGFGSIIGWGTGTSAVKLDHCQVSGAAIVIDAYEGFGAGGSKAGVGGIVGKLDVNGSNVANSSVAGSMLISVGANGRVYTGGILGSISENRNVTVSRSHFIGDISARVAGGIIGFGDLSGGVDRCYFAGNMSASDTIETNSFIGGLVGLSNNMGIKNSFVYGTVSGYGNVGGLMGECDGGSLKIENSYCNAIVGKSGATGAGGIVGYAKKAIATTNTYFVGQIIGNHKGAIAGGNSTDASKSLAATGTYYDKSLMRSAPDMYGVSGTNTGVTTGGITKTGLGSAYVSETSWNYPQLSVFSGSGADPVTQMFSDLSTRKVFHEINASSIESLIEKKSFKTADYTGASGSVAVSTTGSGIFEGPASAAPEGTVLIRETQENSIKYTATGYKGGVTFILSPEVVSAPAFSVTQRYNVSAKPFEYGEGTEDDPYMIYDEAVYRYFVEYVSGGKDSLTYYKVGSVAEETYGEPITIDMSASSDTIQPVMYFRGHFNGNNSTLVFPDAGIDVIKDSASTVYYGGMFGSIAEMAASVQDLTIKNVRITGLTGNDVNINYMGGLAGYAVYANFSNIHVDGIQISDPKGNGNIGGIVGRIDQGSTSGTKAVSISDCSVRDGKLTAGRYGAAGGILGYSYRVPEASMLNVAAEARVDGYYAGGLAGRIEGKMSTNASSESNLSNFLIEDATAVADLSTQYIGGGLVGQDIICNLTLRRAASYGTVTAGGGDTRVGGLIGDVDSSSTAPVKLHKTVVEDSVSCMEVSGSSSIGGLIGNNSVRETIQNICVKGSAFAGELISSGDLSKAGGLLGGTPTVVFSETQTDDTLEAYFGAIFSDSWYRRDLNHVEAVSLSNVTGSGIAATPGALDVGKSTTWSLSSSTLGENPEGLATDGTWEFTKGLYPILTHKNLSVTSAAVSLKDQILLNSVAVHKTRAGAMADNAFSNVFLTCDEASLEIISGHGVSLTKNGKMVQTVADSAGAQNLRVTYTPAEGPALTRDITYQAGVKARGTMDISWYVINPDGQWEDSWLAYTADQLQGLALLCEAQRGNNSAVLEAIGSKIYRNHGSGNYIYDDNGVPVTAGGFTVSASQELGLGKNLDLSAYERWLPVGNQKVPFNQRFAGRGFCLTGLNLQGVSEESAGLFGVLNGVVENLGILTGDGDVTSGSAVGSIVGTVSADPSTTVSNGAGNSVGTIRGCFSSMGLHGKEGGGSAVGGVAGRLEKGALIEDSFFTGFIDIASGSAIAGGIAGGVSEGAVSRCYSAGYLDAERTGALVGALDSGGSVMDSCFDKAAVGMVEAGPGESEKTAAELLTTVMGDAWSNPAGRYPVQTVFLSGDGSAINGEAAILPVYYNPSARRMSTAELPVSSGAVTALGRDVVTWREPELCGLAAVNDSESGDAAVISMNESGYAMCQVSVNGSTRRIYFNLRCWYNDVAEKDGKACYTITAPSELRELAMIVNGTLTAETNPNGTHMHGEEGEVPFSFENTVVKLGGNVDLNAFEGGYWPESVGSAEHPFCGTFDGAGYMVSGLSQSVASPGALGGLFGRTSGATIQNLGLVNSRIKAESAEPGIVAGGIAASAHSTRIENCFTSAEISGGSRGGAVAGTLSGTSAVINCFSMSQITGCTEAAGGIAAEAREGTTISRSHSTGLVRASETGAAGGVAAMGAAAVTNCLSAAYAGGGTDTYPVAPGADESCKYDKKLTKKSDAAGGYNTDELTTEEGYYDTAEIGARMAADASVYQESAYKLSILPLRFDRYYNDFTTAYVDRGIAVSDPDSASGAAIKSVSVNATGGILLITPEQDRWAIQNDAVEGGAPIITASLPAGREGQEITIRKPYYSEVKATLLIRYQFDFSAYLNKVGQKSREPLSGAWNGSPSAGETVILSSPADYTAFSAYVNGGGATRGVTFKLGQNLNLSGVSAAPVGTAANPFEGTFDGNFYTVSNLGVVGNGLAGAFGYVGSAGEVKNVKYDGLSVAASAGAGGVKAAAIAAVNEGKLSDVAVVGGAVTVNNDGGNPTYFGTLAAENSGVIKGCYYYNPDVSLSMVIPGAQPEQGSYVGGLTGRNTGALNGCYVNTLIAVPTGGFNPLTGGMRALVGDQAGQIYNCYFKLQDQDDYDEMPLYNDIKIMEEGTQFIIAADSDAADLAEMMSSRLYGGTYYSNGTYPDLYAFDIMNNYDLSGLEMMLSVRNILEGTAGADPTEQDTFMNALCVCGDYYFPLFSSVSLNGSVIADLPILNQGYGYEITAKVYGADCAYGDLSAAGSANVGTLTATRTNGAYKVTLSDLGSAVTKMKVLMLNIKLTETEMAYPWGAYRAGGSK